MKQTFHLKSRQLNNGSAEPLTHERSLTRSLLRELIDSCHLLSRSREFTENRDENSKSEKKSGGHRDAGELGNRS